MIFSSTVAGVAQSIRRSTRKPRLNQAANRWRKSVSIGASSGRRVMASRSCSRICTSATVPCGARFSRRNSSCRRGSVALCSSLAVLSEKDCCQASNAASMRARSEARQQRFEKGDARTGFQLVVARENFSRQRHSGGFPADRQQLFAQLGKALGIGKPGRRPAALDKRPPAFGYCLQEFAEK